jgi:hypothetical protein
LPVWIYLNLAPIFKNNCFIYQDLEKIVKNFHNLFIN